MDCSDTPLPGGFRFSKHQIWTTFLNSLRGLTFDAVALSHDGCKFINAGLDLPRLLVLPGGVSWKIRRTKSEEPSLFVGFITTDPLNAAGVPHPLR